MHVWVKVLYIPSMLFFECSLQYFQSHVDEVDWAEKRARCRSLLASRVTRHSFISSGQLRRPIGQRFEYRMRGIF